MAHDDASTSGSDPSLADLVGQATSQISTLIRDELTLARLEVAQKARRAGVGGGLLGVAGVLALFGIGLLLTLTVVLLDLVWPLWTAILVVMVLVFAAAGISVLVGRRELSQAAPPLPTETVDSVKADLQTVKDAIQEGRHP
jgi:uncharacterized membrane protein YqjE